MTYDSNSRLSRGAAARELGIPRREVVRAIQLGSLSATKTDGGWVVLGSDLADYARKRNAVPTTVYDYAEQLAANFRSDEIRPVIHEEKT